jgi:hypothetical protein
MPDGALGPIAGNQVACLDPFRRSVLPLERRLKPAVPLGERDQFDASLTPPPSSPSRSSRSDSVSFCGSLRRNGKGRGEMAEVDLRDQVASPERRRGEGMFPWTPRTARPAPAAIASKSAMTKGRSRVQRPILACSADHWEGGANRPSLHLGVAMIALNVRSPLWRTTRNWRIAYVN